MRNRFAIPMASTKPSAIDTPITCPSGSGGSWKRWTSGIRNTDPQRLRQPNLFAHPRRHDIRRLLGEQPLALFDVIPHSLRRKGSPLEELSAQFGEEGAVHAVPGTVVAAEAL